MPRGDRTGPAGMGPMTGRGAGYCTGNNRSGAVNPNIPRNNRNVRNPGFFGRGAGQGAGRGFGRGLGRRR